LLIANLNIAFSVYSVKARSSVDDRRYSLRPVSLKSLCSLRRLSPEPLWVRFAGGTAAFRRDETFLRLFAILKNGSPKRAVH
jgi:hypothetical protein